MNLFCIAHAGGSSSVFRGLVPHLPGSIDFCPLELPGRGRRLQEPLLYDIAAMIEDLEGQISSFGAAPYALYGHSMGALLACLLAQRANSLGQSLARHLFVSGRKSPVTARASAPISRLPRDVFFEKIIGLGGTPPAIAAEMELLCFLEPLFRADFAAMENYLPSPVLIDTPLTVMTGKEEGMSPDDVQAWRRSGKKEISFFDFSGGHFFIFEHWPQIGRLISTAMEKTMHDARPNGGDR